MAVQHSMATHPIVAEVFQSEPKWWIGQQTDSVVPAAALLAKLLLAKNI